MIIVKLQGGLGNQMLQYSFGKLLEDVYKKEVAYDLSFFSDTGKYTKRPYLLDKFKTRVRIATDEEIQKTKFPYGVISKCIYVYEKAINKIFLKRYHVVYEAFLLKKIAKKEVMYLEGYFHSYRYINPILEMMQQELVLSEVLSPEVSSLAAEIHSCESVFVHIRRGDFLKGGADLQVLNKEYYKRATGVIASHVKNPQYYIFSDDSDWVKREMEGMFGECVYVSVHKLRDYEEFFLMSRARHGIIANSTFSWWGAMLSTNKDKVVICPQDWKNVNLKGDINLCPPEWISL